MKSEIKWFLGMLVVVTAVTAGATKAAYVPTGPDTGVVVDDPTDVQTSTMLEYTDVDTDAEEWGYCHSDVYTRAWATAVDSAATDAMGEPWWKVSWEWEGPPSTPAGGILNWAITAEGRADAWGLSDPGNGGSAYSEAYGHGLAWVSRRGEYPFIGGATAEGYVTDDNTGVPNAAVFGSAEEDGLPITTADPGLYEAFIDWTLSADSYDVILIGTSTFWVLAGVYCTGEVEAIASGAGSESEALAQTYTVADAWLAATFTSW